MKRYAVRLLCLLATLVPSIAGADARTVVNTQVYAVPIRYNHSDIKSDGYVTGMYAYIGHGRHNAFEFDASRSQINYKVGSDLKQLDFTGVYSYYRTDWKYRAGIHYIDSSDDWSNGGKTLEKFKDIGTDNHATAVTYTMVLGFQF